MRLCCSKLLLLAIVIALFVHCLSTIAPAQQTPRKLIHRPVVNRSLTDRAEEVGSGAKSLQVPAPRLRMYHLQEEPGPAPDALFPPQTNNPQTNRTKTPNTIADSGSIGDSATIFDSGSIGDSRVQPPGPLTYSLQDPPAPGSIPITDAPPQHWSRSVVLPDNGMGGCAPCAGGKCLQYRWQASYDLLLLNYHKEGGIAVGIDTPVGDDGADFDLAAAHRAIARYAIDNKLHAKAKWFFFGSRQATILNPNSFVDLETYNIDLMFGRKFCTGRGSWIELESGARWMEFREDMIDDNDIVQFKRARTDQLGIVFGGSAVQRLTRHFSLYMQGYISYTEGDYRRIAGVQNDVLQNFDIHSYEVSTGIQIDRRLRDGSNFFFRSGVEFLNYQNIGSAFDNGNDETLAGFRDVEFAGFSFRFGLRK